MVKRLEPSRRTGHPLVPRQVVSAELDRMARTVEKHDRPGVVRKLGVRSFGGSYDVMNLTPWAGWVEITDAGEDSEGEPAYAWHELYDDGLGAFSQQTEGRSGTLADCPLREVQRRADVPIGEIVYAWISYDWESYLFKWDALDGLDVTGGVLTITIPVKFTGSPVTWIVPIDLVWQTAGGVKSAQDSFTTTTTTITKYLPGTTRIVHEDHYTPGTKYHDDYYPVDGTPVRVHRILVTATRYTRTVRTPGDYPVYEEDYDDTTPALIVSYYYRNTTQPARQITVTASQYTRTVRTPADGPVYEEDYDHDPTPTYQHGPYYPTTTQRALLEAVVAAAYTRTGYSPSNEVRLTETITANGPQYKLTADASQDRPLWLIEASDGTDKVYVGADFKLTTSASSTTAAGLNLPHGAAPTVPVNGDVWTTTAGVLAHVDGTTRSLYPATSATITVAATTDTTCSVALFEDPTGDLAPKTDAGLTYNATTNALTTTTFIGALTGNASTATALQTARTIGGTSFDGTANIVPATITVADTTDTTCFVALFESATGALAPKTDGGITYDADTGTLTATGMATGHFTGDDATFDNGTFGVTISTVFNGLQLYDPTLTAPLIIAVGSNLTAPRTLTITTGDADRTLTIAGNATISGTNTGDQTSVTGNAGTVTVADAGGDTTTWVLLGTAQTGSLSPATDAGLTYNAATNALTATTFVGAVTGNVTGNVSGSSGSCTGNAATVTTNANLTGEVTSVGNAATVASTLPHALTLAIADDQKNAPVVNLILSHTTSDTPEAMFGCVFKVLAETTTTVDTHVAETWYVWAEATHASRRGLVIHYVYDTAVREAFRYASNGSAAQIGFLGNSAVVKQTGDAGTALVTFGLMSGTPTFAGANLTGTVAVVNGGTGAASAAQARINLGLGTMAEQNANSVSITGGTITSITDLAVADGGTAASTAAGARSNLGADNADNLASGTVVVARGGTGRASHTAYAVLCGGTTTTAAQQSIASVGTAGQVLTSNGASNLPTFQTSAGSAVSCRVYEASAETISHSTVTKLPFDSERWDASGFHSTGADTTRLTCPSGLAGKYFVWGSILWTANSGGSYRWLGITKNNTLVGFNQTTVSTQAIAMQVTAPVDLAEGDYVELECAQDCGTTLSSGNGDDYANEFGLFRIGN